MIRPGYLTLLCGLVLSTYCLAQPARPDTSFLATARLNQEALYNRFIRGQARLYNGSEYRDFFSKNDEHPFFGIDDWSYGDILYDEELYKNIPLFYDIYHDKVITEHLLSGAKLELISEKVQYFSFSGHSFVRLGKDELNVITDGFYELLYNGATKVYCRREKLLQQKIESNNIIERFEPRNRIYILSKGKYFPVRKKASVLEVLSDKKQEIKSFIKKNNIKWSDDREKAIVRVTTYYDSQNK